MEPTPTSSSLAKATEPPLEFEGQVVLITGAGNGIGRATSIKMAALGANLALSDINTASLDVTMSLCAQNLPGQSHMSHTVDVGSTQAVGDFVAAAAKQYGQIHHVFNCAGVNPTRMALEQTTDEYYAKLMTTNLAGVFNVTRACIPHVRTGGSFVNVSSIAGIRAFPGMAVYCATKAGIIGFSQSMALELGPKGIRTNIIAPGEVDTTTNASVVAGGKALEVAATKVSLGRMGTVDEIADVAAFLFGRGSRYMNGSVVEVNGGVF